MDTPFFLMNIQELRAIQILNKLLVVLGATTEPALDPDILASIGESYIQHSRHKGSQLLAVPERYYLASMNLEGEKVLLSMRVHPLDFIRNHPERPALYDFWEIPADVYFRNAPVVDKEQEQQYHVI